MLRAGVLGATGYTGIELIGLLSKHPNVELIFAASESSAGKNLAIVCPGAASVDLIHPSEASIGDVDVLFLCLPHTASAPVAKQALQDGASVVDLSADFRLKDAAQYAQWYRMSHPCPELLGEAVYGLTEVERDRLQGARLVANPGCYPTSALLALRPIVLAGGIGGQLIIDAKSGVSGAGRSPKPETHFVEVADNFKPYSVGRAHRHLPEIEQELAEWSGERYEVVFSPHLLPVARGLLSTIYAPLAEGWDEARVRGEFARLYADEPFVEVLPEGQLATLGHVNHTNLCVIGISLAHRMLIITSAIDNLLKGASGQAVQNMNVMFGFEETEGLL
jgi:N-acetyl-gamma-glutamyl-phosphate reductase